MTKAIPHGTVGGYNNHDCRCSECREAFRAAHRDWVSRRKGLVPPRHGYQVAYLVYGCRCSECVDWAKAWQKRRYRAAIAKAEGVE